MALYAYAAFSSYLQLANGREKFMRLCLSPILSAETVLLGI